MASAVEDNPALYCTLCLNQYDKDNCQPKLLNCHHSFCLGCINKLVSFGSILCPNCKRRTAVPSGGTIKLQYNFYSDLMRESTSQLASGDSLCQEHDKNLDIWCKCCMKAICVKCAFGFHKTHKQDDIDAMKEGVKNMLAAKIKPLKDKMSCCRENLKSLEAKKDVMEKNINKVDQEFDMLFKQLETKKNEIKDYIFIGNKGAELNGEIEEQMISLASIENICTIYEKTQNSDTKTLLCAIANTELEQERQRLLKLSLPTLLLPANIRAPQHVDFESVLANLMQNIFKGISSVSLPNSKDSTSNSALESENSDIKNTPLKPAVDYEGASGKSSVNTRISRPITNRSIRKITQHAAEYITTDINGVIYVSCSDKHRVEKFNEHFRHFGHIWFGFNWNPYDLTINKYNNDILCTCFRVNRQGDFLITNCIQIVSVNGSKPSRFIFVQNAGRIGGLAVNNLQQILCSTDELEIFFLDQQGQVLGIVNLCHVIPQHLTGDLMIHMSSDDEIYVGGVGHCIVHVLRVNVDDYKIVSKRRIGGKGNTTLGKFMHISGLAVDSEDDVLISDNDENEIQVLANQTKNWVQFHSLEAPFMQNPKDIAISRDGCHMFVVAEDENDRNCIFKFKYK